MSSAEPLPLPYCPHCGAYANTLEPCPVCRGVQQKHHEGCPGYKMLDGGDEDNCDCEDDFPCPRCNATDVIIVCRSCGKADDDPTPAKT